MGAAGDSPDFWVNLRVRIFGWCMSGAHEGADLEFQTPCKGSYRNLVKETTKRGRKVIVKVLVDEMVYCGCPCHSGEPVKTTRRPARRKK